MIGQIVILNIKFNFFIILFLLLNLQTKLALAMYRGSVKQVSDKKPLEFYDKDLEHGHHLKMKLRMQND